MNSQVYDLNATADLSPEKQSIVRQLSDMFYGYSLIYIRGICEAFFWNVDLCIDKLISSSGDNNQSSLTKAPNYSQALQNASGAVPKPVAYASAIPAKQQTQQLPGVYTNVYNEITNGYKVLILMRGPPGSGKSYLAKSIVRKLLAGRDWKDFVIGADDYFFDALGRYRYNIDRLDEAHNYCHSRVREKTSLGWSPIFVDNTHMAQWEMMPYVKAGVENGYIIEIMEPTTPWRNSAGKLAAKNIHNVQKQKIQRMMEKYEIATTNDLLNLLKETKYTVPLPQLRTFPPPPEPAEPSPKHQPLQPQMQTKIDESIENVYDDNLVTETASKECIVEESTDMEGEPTGLPINITDSNDTWPAFELSTAFSAASRSPRAKSKTEEYEPMPDLENQCILENNNENSTLWGAVQSTNSTEEFNDEANQQTRLLPTVPTVWQAYEQEATNFWGVPVTLPSTNLEPMNTEENNSNCGLLQLLKEGVKSINVPNKAKITIDEEPKSFVRHRVGCENEHQAFIALRQIYPNKPNAELWDLFVKCNGSIDWAVDILLKDEDSLSPEAFQESLDDHDNYNCCCDNPENTPPPLTSVSLNEVSVKPQRPKPARHRAPPTAQILEAKEAVEKSFVLGEEHYSSHVKKIRNKRNATEESSSNRKAFIDVYIQTDDVDENDNTSEEGGEGSEVIEINLGEDLIGQLSEIFISETTTLRAPEKYKTNVFMPKTMARELYVLWMESVYNQQEEERQSLLKEDEDFARLLKNPKYQNCKQPPENIKELLDMEYAWMIYKTEQEQYNGVAALHPNDLASHLTRMKLCEIFPNIPRETLLDILAAHNNKFSETVEVLKSSIQPATVDHQVSAEVLIEKARNENEKLDQEANNREQKIVKNNNISSFQTVSKLPKPSGRQSSLSPEEAKRLALSEFEETRNYAVHHCQLRAECYQKAKEAIQRGNSGVAVYYSQIANLHKRKIDIYNHRAANCIMEVHDLTQNNPDFIDLHYLHVVEAVACLDIFVDRHIAKLRSIFRSFKYVFIITGRGLHSTGGVSMIKTRVKSRLKERNLKWSEVNPGLLKVKIFSASKYSKNL